MIQKSKKNGFTLIECIIAILCDFVVMSLVLVFINACVHIVHLRTSQQDQFAILQLRQLLATSSDVEVESNFLKLLYEHEEIIIKWDKNRIVRTPGYEIWIENVEKGEFYEEDKNIYLSFTKENEEFIYQLY
ncbi:MAG: ComGF family competence protein [Bacillota bacterium]|nr:ComGF family competence protein [Bacillota bacterium]